MELWYSIVELLPFSWAAEGSMYFMKNALLALLVVSPLFGILSTMVVTRHMSFFSDALGHSAFTGVAIGSLCGLAEPLWGAVIFAALLALLFTFVRRRTSLASDTVIGVFSAVHPALAGSRGINIFWQDALFSVAVAVVVTLSMTWVGLLVINSLLVLPAAAARNLAKNMWQYHLLSLLAAVVAGVAGLLTSYYVGSSTGACITLYLAVWFALTFCIRKK